ncbi:MAG: HAMP domain-containing sensor histidine kinase [Chloroflexi bacterium]|nr:HAMP domain-containing sensor histidine kinase [Chloroflexota bacterium]
MSSDSNRGQDKKINGEDVARDLDDLAHALRSPLTALQGGLELLDETDGATLSPPARRSLNVAMSASRRLSTLIDDTLDVARARAGQLDLTLSVAPARSLVDTAITNYRTAGANDSVEIDIDCTDVEVVADDERIPVVIGRLIEFVAGRAGTVRIEVSREGADARFHLSAPDAGDAPPGRPDRKNLSRAETLAIAMCRAVVELHGRTISVDYPSADDRSEGGSGSVANGRAVSFTLPTAD